MISLNILFANDDVLTQWVFTDVLAGAGFTVVSACRAQQVIELLRDDPDFDVLLLDTALLQSQLGEDVGQLWREVLPGRPVIYTGPEYNAIRCHLSRGESFLREPFAAGTLLRRIDTALARSCFRPVSPSVFRQTHHVH